MILKNKLQVQLSLPSHQVHYQHPFIPDMKMNSLIGQVLQFQVSSCRQCQGCEKNVKKIVAGYCYPCSKRLACCDLCILKPHLCHYEQGTCREPQWGLKHCFSDHYLYLSVTSGIKVGLTRASQFQTRWIDQGAVKAVLLAQLSSRYQAGVVEEYLSKTFDDKTNWRHLITGQISQLELLEERFEQAKFLIKEEKKFENFSYKLLDYHPVEIHYPVEKFPQKAKTINLDKTSIFEDKLIGIKGQYLFFEELGALNMRKYQGYDINIEVVS